MKGRNDFSGMIHNIDILEYVQFLIMIGARTILELQLRRGPKSKLFIDHGHILHAVSGDLDGEDAFYRCVQSEGGVFMHFPWTEPVMRTIEASGDFLLFEAARRRDERLSCEK
jgi:hypothetical protein